MQDETALRAELARLTEALRSRRSVELAARSTLLALVWLLSIGVGLVLMQDPRGSRWPLYLLAAVWLVLPVLAARDGMRARRHSREEDVQFARLREVRKALGLPDVSWGAVPSERRAA